MLRSTGAATASVLLFATALAFALARTDGPSEEPRSAGTGRAPTHFAPARPTLPSAPSRGTIVGESTDERMPEARVPQAPRAPVAQTEPHKEVPDLGAPYADIYDVRASEDALLVGAGSATPQVLPPEVSDPPESLVDPPPPPVVADDLEVEDIRPYSAVVSFTTDQDVAGVVGFGRKGATNFASGAIGREHRIELVGLVPDTDYVVQVVSHTGQDRPEGSFATDERPAHARGEHRGRDRPARRPAVLPGDLHTERVPRSSRTCSTPASTCSAGITPAAPRSATSSRASSRSTTARSGRVPWADRDLADDGMIGFTQPDEPDGLGLDPSTLPDIDEPGKVTFLTLTQHFAPGTGDLPWQYPGYYEGFVPKADVLGVDFYPLQGLCSPEKLALNHDVQVELVRLARGKPTFQWIETAEMNCPGRADAAITAETLRAEMLLAIAGGANGLGVFPARLDASAAFA